MTKIVYYLDCLATSRSYEPDELARLQGAYDSARKLLDLDDTDPRRQQVALLVFTLAEKAASPDQLAAIVADAFRDK
jgi:hypothetical protein